MVMYTEKREVVDTLLVDNPIFIDSQNLEFVFNYLRLVFEEMNLDRMLLSFDRRGDMSNVNHIHEVLGPIFINNLDKRKEYRNRIDVLINANMDDLSYAFNRFNNICVKVDASLINLKRKLKQENGIVKTPIQYLKYLEKDVLGFFKDMNTTDYKDIKEKRKLIPYFSNHLVSDKDLINGEINAQKRYVDKLIDIFGDECDRIYIEDTTQDFSRIKLVSSIFENLIQDYDIDFYYRSIAKDQGVRVKKSKEMIGLWSKGVCLNISDLVKFDQEVSDYRSWGEYSLFDFDSGKAQEVDRRYFLRN